VQELAYIALVDGTTLRRAAISHALSTRGTHVEPFESIRELTEHWPRSGLILAQDDGSTIASLIEHMEHAGDWLPVVGFAEAPSPRHVVDAVLSGALDYVAWPFEAAELFDTLTAALRRAADRGNVRLRVAHARSRLECLSRREREVLSCVARGLSSRKIGEMLAISPRTVEIHRANLLHKLGANHTSEAIRIAIEADLVR
jgi:FixJ family two-component response regulator